MGQSVGLSVGWWLGRDRSVGRWVDGLVGRGLVGGVSGWALAGGWAGVSGGWAVTKADRARTASNATCLFDGSLYCDGGFEILAQTQL